jgi:glycosyltransferase involved in cell wall biosynthesis
VEIVDAEGEPADLLISLVDGYDVRMAPSGATTIAWVRDPVERWVAQPWFEHYDLVVAGSASAAAAIAGATHFSPCVVPPATDATRFCPGDPIPALAADFAFAGDLGDREPLETLSVRPGERFILVGRGWSESPRLVRYWAGHLDAELLPALYRSAPIVLDDTAIDTEPHGVVNDRVLDALACGALVLSTNVEGAAELFDGELPTYRTRQDLREQLDRYLQDADLRRETAARLRQRVLDRYTYDQVPGRLLAATLDELERPRVALKVCVPARDRLDVWGDTYVARGLASALEGEEFSTRMHVVAEWDQPSSQGVDIAIHLRGLSPYTPKAAQFNVLWVISHPAELLPGECDGYDLVLAASEVLAGKLAAATSTPVVYLPQATDGRRFRPVEPDPELAEQVLFVGQTRHAFRPAVYWAVERGLPLGVYGEGWAARLPAHFVRRPRFPNTELARLYASAKVVLNDHWPDMAEHGIVSNRIFDVLGSGGVVVSDRVGELTSLFGDVVPTFGDAAELETVVMELLDDDDRRRDLAERGARLIAERHTFAHRARALAPLVRAGLDGRVRDLEGSRWSFAADTGGRPVGGSRARL